MIGKVFQCALLGYKFEVGFHNYGRTFVCHFSLQLVLRHNSFESFLILILVIHKLNWVRALRGVVGNVERRGSVKGCTCESS